MYRLLIDGESIENGTGKIQFSKTIIDITDLSKRGITFTNSFTVPPSSINNRILGNPQRLSSNNGAFERRKKYQLIDGSSIVSVGDVIIKSFDEKKGTQIQLAEGLEFWEAAGKKLLIDLPLHDDDFIYTPANLTALEVKTDSVFLVADHEAGGGIMRPCYNWKSILNNIFSDLGYVATYDLFARLSDLGSLSNADKFLISDYKIKFANLSTIGVLPLADATAVFSKAGNVSRTGSTLSNATLKTSYVIKGTISSAQPNRLIITAGANVERVIIPQGESFLNYRTNPYDLSTAVSFEIETAATLTDVYIYSAIDESEIAGFTITDYLVLADYNLMNQTYSDFIKTLFVLLFANFEIDELTKTIKFIYLPPVLSTNNATDLSAKVSRYAEITTGEMYGKLNRLSYSNDTNIDSDLGTAYLSFENENAQSTKELFSITQYSASQEANGKLLVDIYNTTEGKRRSTKDRILLFTATGEAVFSGIGWQQIYSDHYFSFVEATKRERVLSVEAYLTFSDFRAISKRPIIFISSFQSYFLVSSIEGFERGNLCKMKIIKYN